MGSGFARFPPILHVQLVVDAVHLRFHRIDRDNQFLGNLRVGATGSEETKYTPSCGLNGSVNKAGNV